MTNEEALRLIQATESCFVVWSTVTNEIVGVTPGRSSDELLDPLPTMNAHDGPTCGRFFASASVSMSTLRDQQAETTSIAERVWVLCSLRAWDIEELIWPLETGVFPPNLSHGSDAPGLIEEIYYGRSTQLSAQHLARLEAIAGQGACSHLESRAAAKLECVLAVMQADRPRLERFWRLRFPDQMGGFYDYAAIAAGDLALDEDEVVRSLIAAVEKGWPFEARFNAMLALGKIGASAGESAASAIATHIYDSSAQVSAARDKVLARIRTPASKWRACGTCVRGMVRRPEWFFTHCPKCLGIGQVRAEPSSIAASGSEAGGEGGEG